MPAPRLIAIITALMIVAGTPGARAEYSLAQLQDIERLIVSRDCASLWAYLQINPDILAGDDPLALELRIFAESTQRGQIDCFSSRQATKSVDPDIASDVESVLY